VGLEAVLPSFCGMLGTRSTHYGPSDLCQEAPNLGRLKLDTESMSIANSDKCKGLLVVEQWLHVKPVGSSESSSEFSSSLAELPAPSLCSLELGLDDPTPKI
jgi:hypothetical protein